MSRRDLRNAEREWRAQRPRRPFHVERPARRVHPGWGWAILAVFRAIIRALAR
jgi:hypothetical protein